jgi:hypothetical protein
VGRPAVSSALVSGLIVRVGRGRFAPPDVTRSLGVAHGMSGVLSHLSAARWWGWEVASPLIEVEVLLPRNRRVVRTWPLGLTVVRFASEHVMVEQSYTRSVLDTCASERHPWRGVAAARPTAA